MPFIKRTEPTSTSAKATEEDALSHISGLRSSDAERRWNSARALGGVVSAVPALGAALEVEGTARVRESLMTALMRTGGRESALVLMPYLRSQDAGLRNAAIEALQAMPHAIVPFIATLLGDNDSDVRILATELTRSMPPTDATRVLCTLLDSETHPNVCGAAIEVLAEVGTREALPTLATCTDRFSGIPFLSFAISTTMARITSAES